MKKLISTLLLALFVLSACNLRKPEIDIVLPTEAPAIMQPTMSPNI